MRVLSVFAGICLALFTTLTPALSQQNKPNGPSVAPAEGQAVPPTTSKKPTGVQPGKVTGGTTVAPLTEAECTELGGTVLGANQPVSACLSGKACQTKGEDGKINAVCISKQ